MRSRINALTMAANKEAEVFHDRLNALDDDIVMLGGTLLLLSRTISMPEFPGCKGDSSPAHLRKLYEHKCNPLMNRADETGEEKQFILQEHRKNGQTARVIGKTLLPGAGFLPRAEQWVQNKLSLPSWGAKRKGNRTTYKS